ncbi:MAG: glycerophosphodiester phosphodiesterase [Clostridiaceae bacterium]|jgi:glycerophosphoryl diester phosphodiesterase|nr:glycerophosphodiester phosphodiesterase [Clostridiaceae bacterium]
MPNEEGVTDIKKPVIIAHRGASRQAPENTMAAFRKALELGAGGIETDVHFSADGHLMVTHDEKLDRTSNGKGLIRDKSFDELKALDFGSWFSPEFKDERIPELDELLELISGWDGLLNIEIKNGPVFYPGIEQAVASAIREYRLTNRTIISSFNHYSLVEIRKIDPEIKTAPLYMAGIYEPWKYARSMGAIAIHPLFYNIVPEVLKGCKLNNIMVNPFTVDQPEQIKAMVEAGVDGIITNVPDIAIKIANEMGGKGTL